MPKASSRIQSDKSGNGRHQAPPRHCVRKELENSYWEGKFRLSTRRVVYPPKRQRDVVKTRFLQASERRGGGVLQLPEASGGGRWKQDGTCEAPRGGSRKGKTKRGETRSFNTFKKIRRVFDVPSRLRGEGRRKHKRQGQKMEKKKTDPVVCPIKAQGQH